MSEAVKEVSGEELKALLAEGKKVVCDFWAAWCGPCRMLGPVVEEMAAEFADKAEFVKVNIDQNEEIAAELGVMSIPDVFVFENGGVKDHNLGYVPKEIMREFLSRNL